MGNEIVEKAAKKISGLVRDYYIEAEANYEVNSIIQSAITSATAKDKAEIERLKKFIIEECTDTAVELHAENEKQKQRIVKLEVEIKELTEALEWYADESINQHNYHATMNTDLTAKAREVLKGDE